MSAEEQTEQMHILQPVIDEAVGRHVDKAVRKKGLVDRTIRICGILVTIGGTIGVIWAALKFSFSVGLIYAQYKDDMKSIESTKHKADSCLVIVTNISKQQLEHEVDDNSVHVVYDKSLLRIDTVLTQNERNILRNDENKNIVSK